MDKTQRPATTNVDLPYEIQRPIFEMAARSHRGAGFNLIQVAHYVYTWIESILYERIEILSLRSARSLLQTISAKDRAFLDSTARALAVSGDVDLKYIKPIFAACSRGMVSFSAWGTAVNPLIYLPFIRSPYLRRLALISNTPARSPYDNPFNMIPTAMLTMLTHLVVVSDSSGRHWDDLENALTLGAISGSSTVSPTTIASFNAFQNLTHLAVTQNAWRYISRIRNVARKLRYFVVLSRENSLSHRGVIRGVQFLNDRRFVVVDKEYFLAQGDLRCVTTFWQTVETLFPIMLFPVDGDDRWFIGY